MLFLRQLVLTDLKPIVFPDSITVLHKLATKPTKESTSVELEAILLSHTHQRIAARFLEDVSVYDYRVGKKTNLEPFMVDELGEAYDLQERTKKSAIQDVLELQRSLD